MDHKIVRAKLKQIIETNDAGKANARPRELERKRRDGGDEGTRIALHFFAEIYSCASVEFGGGGRAYVPERHAKN